MAISRNEELENPFFKIFPFAGFQLNEFNATLGTILFGVGHIKILHFIL